jgi:hypothetical protein
LATQVVFADGAPGPSQLCEAASKQEAKELADRYYEQREYQRAGECYDDAGDRSRAQLAFLKAAAPNAAETARALKKERDAAKGLFTQVQQAFHKDH